MKQKTLVVASNNQYIQIIKGPAQSVNAYKTAEGWSDFASIISGY